MEFNLIYGVGVNDASYVVSTVKNGNVVRCPFYEKWKSMITRCYSSAHQRRFPTYYGCSVFSDWLTFSNFKKWMEQQDWKDKHLDKDIIVIGNKIYSPETCAFVDGNTNNFTVDRQGRRGEWPLGVSFSKQSGKLQVKCSNPFTKKVEFLGRFDSKEDAHEAWRKRKHELACQIAELQTDERVAKALRTRYL